MTKLAIKTIGQVNITHLPSLPPLYPPSTCFGGEWRDSILILARRSAMKLRPSTNDGLQLVSFLAQACMLANPLQ